MAKKKIKNKKPKLAKRFLILINLLLFISGLAILLCGVATKLPDMFNIMMKLISKSGYIPLPMISVIRKVVNGTSFLAPILILVGGAISFISFCGCIGACCNDKLLKMYRIALMVLALVICLGGYGMYKNTKMITPIMANQLATIFPHFDKPFARIIVHTIQMQGECCGILTPSDFVENESWKIYLENSGKMDNITGEYPVPDSCCIEIEKDCGLTNYDDYKYHFEKEMEMQELDMVSIQAEVIKVSEETRDVKWEDEEKQDLVKEIEDFMKNDEHSVNPMKCKPQDKKCLSMDFNEGEVVYEKQVLPYRVYKKPPPSDKFKCKKISDEDLDIYNSKAKKPLKQGYKCDKLENINVAWNTRPTKLPIKDKPDIGGPIKPTKPSIKDKEDKEYLNHDHDHTIRSRRSTRGHGDIIDEYQEIWHMGCAVKFGKMISDEKDDLFMICLMLVAPLYICYVMAGKIQKYNKIKKYEEEKDEEEE